MSGRPDSNRNARPGPTGTETPAVLDADTAEALSERVGAQIPLIPPPAQSPPAPRWTFIQNDLSAALNTWQELENSPLSLSPDEEELLRIKSLIARLKDKLEQF